jgi:large subunit ribosomal protein L23
MTAQTRNNKDGEKDTSKSNKKTSSSREKKKKDVKKVSGYVGRTLASQVLRRPYVTEKSHGLAQNGVYVFEVRLDADKKKIRQAVEELYEVNVVSVHTIFRKGKERRFGRFTGKTGSVKKAMVRLKKGQSIEIFEGA